MGMIVPQFALLAPAWLPGRHRLLDPEQQVAALMPHQRVRSPALTEQGS
jgi:hypothetical protein